ncbi:chalcone synthase-like protein [Trifolium pratense]|uniref:Chalcone synthase-like protein n=1 Tax=Trifolium pratense TaxID=57577 RepID=A0A2K3NUP6_TRIPR|nr:chalcone synthase-like protein [Trifolium pratense]PNY06743.1 chalcone synthase-like protein [Trifolium pratense]
MPQGDLKGNSPINASSARRAPVSRKATILALGKAFHSQVLPQEYICDTKCEETYI